MKKKLLSLFLTILCVVSAMTGCGTKEKESSSSSGNTPVTLNEVAHSIK